MNNNLPLISVVVPTCDRPRTLIDSIESIIANDYPASRFEIIVVDQSSDSKTRDAVEKKFSQNKNLTYLHSTIKCSSDSRNKGWQRAKGEIAAFTDDDAWVDRCWLSALAAAFKKYKKTIGMVGGRIVPIFQGEKPAWLPPEREYLLPSFDYGGKMRSFPANAQPISVNLAIWRSVIEEIGGFDTRLGLKNDAEIPYITGEDTYLGIKVRDAGYSIIYQPDAVAYHPVTAQRMKRGFFLKRNFHEGATLIAIENAKEELTKQVLGNHIKWHLIRACWLILPLGKHVIIPKKGRAKSYMLTAAKIAFSLGAIKYSLYLRKKIN